MATIGRDIYKAKELLLHGEVVGIPTETVYGLAGNALNEASILKIFEIKNRPKFDPIIAHVDTIEKVEQLVMSIPSKAKKLAEKFWPGPMTLLLEKVQSIPDILTSGHSRVGIRVPNHPLTLSLLSIIDFPVAAPSANPFGYVSPICSNHVEEKLGKCIKYILEGGECNVGVESTIVGFEEGEPVIYRFGGISVESIEKEIGRVQLKIHSSSNPSAPGMLLSHYSPGKKFRRIVEENIGEIKDNVGIISFSKKYDISPSNSFVLSKTGDISEAAKNIFKALRKMDQPHIEEVLFESVPEYGLGRAINDKLNRASIHS